MILYFWKFVYKSTPMIDDTKQNKILYLPVYNAHVFLTNFASKIEMHIIHGTFCFHEVICITSQKSWTNSRNKSRQKVSLALYITSVHVHQWYLHQSCNLFTITIKNLLHFLEYFDDKANSTKDLPLGFVKVWSTHLSFGFLNKCGKIWKKKDHENILHSAILNLVHVASKSSSRTPHSWKCYRRCANGHVRSCSSKAAKEHEENIIELDISLNRQNIQWFAATPVTDFRAGTARFDISAEFFQKIIFRQEWCWNAFFFLKTGFKIGVRIIHGWIR